jgi:hypothetical protein
MRPLLFEKLRAHPQIKVSVNLQHVEIKLLLEINNHRNLNGMLGKKQKTNTKQLGLDLI